MKFPDDTFFKKLQVSIEDITNDEQPSFGRVGHPFTVPKGYFEKAKREIIAAVFTEKSHGKVIAFPKFKVWYAAAAVLFLSTITAWFYSSSFNDGSVLVQNLSHEEILVYLESEPIGYSEITSAVDFTNEEIYDINAESTSFENDELDFMLDSPDLLLEEIKQLDEK